MNAQHDDLDNKDIHKRAIHEKDIDDIDAAALTGLLASLFQMNMEVGPNILFAICLLTGILLMCRGKS